MEIPGARLGGVEDAVVVRPEGRLVPSPEHDAVVAVPSAHAWAKPVAGRGIVWGVPQAAESRATASSAVVAAGCVRQFGVEAEARGERCHHEVRAGRARRVFIGGDVSVDRWPGQCFRPYQCRFLTLSPRHASR